jgi:hypothetical protein
MDERLIFVTCRAEWRLNSDSLFESKFYGNEARQRLVEVGSHFFRDRRDRGGWRLVFQPRGQ